MPAAAAPDPQLPSTDPCHCGEVRIGRDKRGGIDYVGTVHSRLYCGKNRRALRDVLGLTVGDTQSTVTARVNDRVRLRAEQALLARGLTIPDGIRMLLLWLAEGKGLPFPIDVQHAQRTERTPQGASFPTPAAQARPRS